MLSASSSSDSTVSDGIRKLIVFSAFIIQVDTLYYSALQQPCAAASGFAFSPPKLRVRDSPEPDFRNSPDSVSFSASVVSPGRWLPRSAREERHQPISLRKAGNMPRNSARRVCPAERYT